jgi:flavin-binding protein dodecin
MKKIILGLVLILMSNSIYAVDYLYTKTFDALTTPNVTSASIVVGAINHSYQIKVTGVSTNVIVRVEGSMDNLTWFNMDDDELDTTYTADGTYNLHKDNFKTYYTRFRFVSETGGTNASITVKYLGSN